MYQGHVAGPAQSRWSLLLRFSKTELITWFAEMSSHQPQYKLCYLLSPLQPVGAVSFVLQDVISFASGVELQNVDKCT